MGKFYISLIVASLFATTTFAQSIKPKAKGNELKSRMDRVATAEELKSFEAKGFKPMGKFDLKHSASTALKKVKRSADSDVPVTETPAGTLTDNAYGIAHGYYVFWGYLFASTSDGHVVEFVEDDNNFYIKNPISTLVTDTWLTGEKKTAAKAGDKDTVLVQLPQPIFEAAVEGSDGQDSLAVLYLMKLGIDQEGYTYPTDDQVAKYTWDGDTLKSIGKEIIGLVDSEGGWYGYGDDSLVVFRQNDVPTSLSTSAVKTKFSLKYRYDPETEYNKLIDGATDGNDYYLGSLFAKQDFYVKGTKEGEKVIFKKQYLGIDTTNLSHIYYVPAKVEFVYNDTYGFYNVGSATEIDQLEYAIGADGKLSTDSAFSINVGKNSVTTSALYDKTVIAAFEGKPATPQTPSIGAVMSYSPTDGYGGFRFDLPEEDADGNMLDVNKLYYVVFIGDENDPDLAPYKFTTDKYIKLDAEMDTIPVTFTDKFDFQTSGTVHTVFINDPVFSDTNVGVKAIYKGGNEVHESGIAWAYVEAGVNGVTTELGTVKSISYYDLSGRRVANPVNGLYIKTVKYDDGTVKSVKVIK